MNIPVSHQKIIQWLERRFTPMTADRIAKHFDCSITTARKAANAGVSMAKVAVMYRFGIKRYFFGARFRDAQRGAHDEQSYDSVSQKTDYHVCPPCNHNCREGRDCPARGSIR